MDLENMKYNSKDKIFHNKCKFCGKDLKPIGLDYLYANMPLTSIEYERCDCKKSKAYWNEIDLKEEIQKKRKHFEQMIRQFYIQNYISNRIQDYQLENFIITENNEKEVKIAKDFTQKCINKNQKNGLIITGKSGTGKTHLATAILNKLTEKDMLVLMGRLILLLDVIKDTFKDFSSKEKDIIELYSKVDMLIIDDLGTERISSWALEKLYTIIENRNENKLPIIVTTRFDKESLLDRFYQSEDEGVLVASASIHGNTKEVALKVVDLLKEKGVKVAFTDLTRDDMAEAVEDAFRYSKMILAGATYDGGVFSPMEDFLHRLQHKGYQNKTVGLIENGSWAPLANKVMKDMLTPMKNITICENTVTIKSTYKDENQEAINQLIEEICH